jgi:thiol-disulfide isomerase/thioredoxin
MQKKPWLIKIIHCLMVATLFLNTTQFIVFAKGFSNSSFFMVSTKETITPTPTPAEDELNDDICGLTADGCGDTENSDVQQAWMNFKAHPSANVVIIMFWMEDCAHCEEVLNTVLPALDKQYDDQIFIYPIELKDIETVDNFYQMAERLGVSKNNIGVPLAIVGNQVLTGDQIKSKLSEKINTVLQNGQKTVLAIPEFADQLPESIQIRQINQQDLLNENSSANQSNSSRIITLLLAIGLPILIILLSVLYFYFKRRNRVRP